MLLAEIILQSKISARERAGKSDRILRDCLESSRSLKSANFTAIDELDLKNLFCLVDETFFAGAVNDQLREQLLPIRFRLSRRMTSSGGITSSRISGRQSGIKEFEIAISSTLLFESFRDDQAILVTGLPCANRFQALQRIMEHEMVHLIEMLLWKDSSCSARRFQSIAKRFFGHNQSTHQLITPADNARRRHNIAPGDWVSFTFEERQRFGYVNRITRRATILVPSEKGTRYTDGKVYEKFYVPFQLLQKSTPPAYGVWPKQAWIPNLSTAQKSSRPIGGLMIQPVLQFFSVRLLWL